MSLTEHAQSSKSKLFRTLVFVATYNEAGNIKALLNGIWSEVPSADILVVDDNSPDGTGELLTQIAREKTALTIIHRPGKLGLGTAHHLAMIYAIKHGYDALITMDADHSHDPKDMPNLISKLAEVDFVIGSRYMQGGNSGYRGYRRFVSVAANKMARLLLGIPLHEFTTSYRGFRVSELAKVNFTKMHNNGYSFFMESVYRFHQAGLRLAETPINFRDRNAGVSKIPRFEILQGATKLMILAASRLLQKDAFKARELIKDACINCNSIYLSEVYPRSLNHDSGDERSNVFRCSSMGHNSKPCIVKCLQCGLAQVPISEHPAGLTQLYCDVVDEDYLANISVKKKTFAHAYKRISKYIGAPSGKLLEVGSYCGLFLLEAKKHGWDVKGIEPSRWAAEYSMQHSNLDVIHGSLEQIAPSLGGGFKVVASWDVLEHVTSPKNFIETAHTLLDSNGILALSTIDIDSAFARILGHRWPWIMEMHLHYFGSKSLENMFKKSGFEIMCVEPYRHYASLKYAYRKFCAILPLSLNRLLMKMIVLVPNVMVPITLGDIKLYVGKKI